MLVIREELHALARSGDVTDLREALQAAVNLEHATMPPYLYALYSLSAGNAAARVALRTVVREEMLHMLLAANLLNAVGGKPVIDDPAFVPRFPGPLPGTIDNGLIVSLAPYSLEQVENVFLKIEEPETPLRFKSMSHELAAAPRTIGQFYAAIRDRVVALGDGIFTGDRARQVTHPQLGDVEAQRVVNVATAVRAIDVIVEQGEGTTESPNAEPETLAHYYRFAELVKGRRLITNPDAPAGAPPEERFVYGGEAIELEPAGILPLRRDPRAADIPSEHPARAALSDANKAYVSVLRHLQSAFDGEPDR